jgi:hypothetical protein
MTTFVPLFTRRVSQHVEVLLVGAILTPDKRTVTASLRVMGLAHTKSFRQYHRVLNRAVWSSLAGVRLLLLLLVSVLAPAGPLVMGLDDTLERRWGVKIKAKGIPRSGALFSQPHGQSQWVAVVEPDALGPDSLGQTLLGPAVLDGPSSLRFHHYNHLVPLCEGDYGSYVWFVHDPLL